MRVASSCPRCGASGNVIHRQLPDVLFGVAGEWDVLRCTNSDCGVLWPDPYPVVDQLSALYESYYTHQPSTSEPSRIRSLVQLCWPTPWSARRAVRRRAMVPAGITPGSILEIGCGNGANLLTLRAAGWEVYGQEIDAKAAAATQRSTGICVDPHPLEETTLPRASFDVVLANHVIEHVADPVATARSARQLLKPDGALILYTPNAASLGHRIFRSHWRGLEVPRHLTVFTAPALTAALRAAGFRWLEVRTTPALGASMALLSFESTARRLPRPMGVLLSRLVAGAFQIFADLVHRIDEGSGDELYVIARP